MVSYWFIFSDYYYFDQTRNQFGYQTAPINDEISNLSNHIL